MSTPPYNPGQLTEHDNLALESPDDFELLPEDNIMEGIQSTALQTHEIGNHHFDDYQSE
ncbi:hypothetical protein BGZ58_009477, partial [Dissophora ornata]